MERFTYRTPPVDDDADIRFGQNTPQGRIVMRPFWFYVGAFCVGEWLRHQIFGIYGRVGVKVACFHEHGILLS